MTTPDSKNQPSGKPPKKRGMSFKEAAFRILSASKDKKPMHSDDITEQALERKLIVTEGQTPAATMSAILTVDILNCERRGERSRFTRPERGKFGLSSWKQHDLERAIERHNNDMREKLLRWLRGMPPECFEQLLAELLGRMGFEDVQTTRLRRDGGIDVRGVMVVAGVVRIRMAVQAKRWANNVQAPEVQKVRGTLQADEQGMIITTSAFSPGAKKEAKRSGLTPVWLIDGEELVSLLFQHELCVALRSKDIFELKIDFCEDNGKDDKKDKKKDKKKDGKEDKKKDDGEESDD